MDQHEDDGAVVHRLQRCRGLVFSATPPSFKGARVNHRYEGRRLPGVASNRAVAAVQFGLELKR